MKNIELLLAIMASGSRAFAEVHNLLDGQPRLIRMETFVNYLRFTDSGKRVLDYISDSMIDLVEMGQAGWVLQPYEEKDGVDGSHLLDYSCPAPTTKNPNRVYQFRRAVAYRWVRYHQQSDQLFCQSFSAPNNKGIGYKNNWVPIDGLEEDGKRKLKMCELSAPWIVEIVRNPEFASDYVCHWLALQGSLANAKISLQFCIPEPEGRHATTEVKEMFSRLFGYILSRQLLEESEGLRQAGVSGDVLNVVQEYAN